MPMNGPPIVRDISGSEIRSYESDGIVCLRGLYSKDWVVAMREAAEASLNAPGELHAELAEQRGEAGRFFHDTFIWTGNETCRRFVFESPAAQVAGGGMDQSTRE